jgi:F-type H+-transporting ATPase subunit b
VKKFAFLLLFMVFLTIGAPPSQAEEPSSEKANSKETSETVKTAFKWVNLAILLGGLVYLLKKPAAEFFESRKNEITDGLHKAEAAQEESARRMKEIEARLQKLSTEIAALQAQADAESAQERETILQEAKRDMERLVEQSHQEIDRVARSIERNIREKIADAVIDRASRTLETQITEDDQKRVVVRFLDKA